MLAATPTLADSSLPPAEWADRQLPDPRAEARAILAEIEPEPVAQALAG